jgi:acyl-coenzyme A thioesterase 13
MSTSKAPARRTTLPRSAKPSAKRKPAGHPPAGFVLPPHPSHFRELIGPVYMRRMPGKPLTALRFGLYVQPKHGNRSGNLHGGAVATLADIAMGYGCAYSAKPMLRLVTVSLSVDYIGSADLGDWIEARIDVIRTGRRVAFAQCDVWNGRKRIARASASFLVVG